MKRSGALLAILAMVVLPFCTASARKPNVALAAQEEASTATQVAGPVPPTITYQGHVYALLVDCFATAFVVGVTVSGMGQQDQLLVAMDYGAGVASLPPVTRPASGALAQKAFGDAVCLNAAP